MNLEHFQFQPRLCFSVINFDEGKLNGFFVRKELKKHGLEKKVEGIKKPPLVIVDDVVTTGQSVMDAVNALMEEGHSPIGIISVIDREDERKLEVLKNGTLKFDSLFSTRNLKIS